MAHRVVTLVSVAGLLLAAPACSGSDDAPGDSVVPGSQPTGAATDPAVDTSTSPPEESATSNPMTDDTVGDLVIDGPAVVDSQYQPLGD